MKDNTLYISSDPQLFNEQKQRITLMEVYNRTSIMETKKRQDLLHQMFAEVGEGCEIEAPFYANWAGKYVHLGNHVYANFNLTLVDDTDIYIGDDTMLGLNCTLTVANHPMDPALRQKGYQYNKPIFIGKNCWLGANVTVLPGVHIGDGTVIGANSLVTHDIPDHVVAYGSPCKVIRPIDEHDHLYYDHDQPIDPSLYK